MIFGKNSQTSEEDFTVVDSAGTLVTGLVDGNFTRKLYNPSGTEVSASVTITITELGNGNYRAAFIPNVSGTWYMSIYHATYFPWGKNDTIQVYGIDFDDIDSSLDNITISINDMTNSLDYITSEIDYTNTSLDNITMSIYDMTSSLDNLSVSMNDVITKIDNMTNSLDYITSEIENANTSLGNITTLLDDITSMLTRSLGLAQENHYLDNTSYDSDNNLTSCRIRLYSNSSNVGSATNIIATYHVTAGYTSNLLEYYKVVKQ